MTRMTKDDQLAQHAEHAKEIDDPDSLVKRLHEYRAFSFARDAADYIGLLEGEVDNYKRQAKIDADRIEQLGGRMAEAEELLRRGIDGTADNLWVSEVRLFLAEAKQ